ncbi:Astra associated protein 1 Asa1 [Ascochyta lentis]
MAAERQSSTLSPAQPSYILRGHASQIHSVQFVRHNARLITGDADGWVIYWKLETKRALAVWKAHDSAILGTAEWGHDKILTHGRDNSLRIWQIRTSDEMALSTALPAEVAAADRPMPWLLHTLPVNTLNFCAFSMCYAYTTDGMSNGPAADNEPRPVSSILVAVPARDDKKAEVYQFPDERLRYVVPRAQSKDTGMVMAVKLAKQSTTQHNLVITGYEGGLTAVHILPRNDHSSIGVAQLVYLSQAHTQPILSLDILPDAKTYFTSGADAIIAAHRLPDLPPSEGESTETSPTVPEAETKSKAAAYTPNSESTSQSLCNVAQNGEAKLSDADDPEHSDISTIASTVTSQDSTHPPLTFTKRTVPNPNIKPQQSALKTGGLSSLLSTEPSHPANAYSPRPPPTPTVQAPHKVNNTKHAGQQSLSIRSDGRLLATGGWDARVRIYSTKTLKEVAVLKWHKEGVYAVAFGEVLDASDVRRSADVSGGGEGTGEVAKRGTGLSKLQKQREEKMQVKHWVAAGAKDGKVSLWEIF